MQNVLILETNKYAIKLQNFEGPLDLLCHLIDKNKMNINTLFMISLFCCKIRVNEVIISLTYVKRFKPAQRFWFNTKIRCNMIL